MLEIAIAILVIFLIFKFNKVLTMFTNLLVTLFGVGEDTAQTYALDVNISNADNVRQHQKFNSSGSSP